MVQSRGVSIRKLALWLTVIGVGVGTFLLLAPAQDMPQAPRINDKLAHILLFLALPLPALVARLAQPWVIAVTTFAYSAVIEVIQPLTGRTFDMADLAANLAGVVLALVLAPRIRRALGAV